MVSPTVHLPFPTEKLVRDLEADVLVIGMGISGAMVAEALSAEGERSSRSTVVAPCADRRRRPLRSSVRIDQPLSKLGRRIGRKVPRALGAAPGSGSRTSRRGSDNSASTATWHPARASCWQATCSTPRACATRWKSRRAAGLQAQYLNAAELKERFGIDRKAAILSPDKPCA